MEKYSKKIGEKDNVVTVIADCVSGDEVVVRFKGIKDFFRCNQNVPFGHKIAIVDIKLGEKIVKYNEPIGTATQDIKKGDWVHIHNVRDDYKVLDREGKPLSGLGE